MKAIQKRRQMTGQGGFTLIELLVVIAILGVLAGVVVFAVSGINDSSEDSACTIEARTVKTAINAYKAQERSWPTAFTGELDGFLDDAPELVDVTYIDSATEPTLAWSTTSSTDCSAATGDPTP